MARQYWYYGTTKKLIVAFASIFDEITIEDDYGRIQKVPLIFAQKEKFIDTVLAGSDFDMDGTTFDIMFPKMGFEISGMNFAPERHTNPMNRFEDETEDGEGVMMYNRVPYDLTFDLFIGSRKLEDSLKVLEQILPFFNPELTVTIKDKQDFKLESNIPIILNSTALNIDYEGSLDTKRTILWTLNFTAKGYYYCDTRDARIIKQTVVDFIDQDFSRAFERLTSTVTPMDASRDDPHIIIDTKELTQDE